MRQFRFVCTALVLSLGLLCPKPASAQSDPNFETGLKPFGSYHGGSIDSVNLNNLSLSIALPLMSYPQTGGKLKLDFDFRINNFSYFYTVGSIACPDGNGDCGTTDWEEPGTIFGITQEGVPVYTGSWSDNGTQYTGQAQITTPDQSVHQLGLTALTGGTWRSADATGYAVAGTYTASVTGPIFDADGLRYSLSNAIIPNGAWYGTSVEDANGNQISLQTGGQYVQQVTGWTDSVGRQIGVPTSTTDYSRCPQPSSTTSAMIWNLPGVNGGTYPLLFCHGGSVLTQYFYWQTCGCDGTQGELEEYSNSGPMLQYIVLPDNTYWAFAYTSDGNSNISQITFPTGGALCYTWHNVVSGNTDGPYYQMTSHVASRTLDPSGTCSQSSPTWTYSQTFPSGGVTTTVTDPAGNNTVHHFTFPAGVQTYYETETDYPAGKTVYNTYAPDNTCAATNGAILSTTKTLWSNGEESEIQYGYDSGFSAGEPYEWDSPPPYGVQMVPESCLYGLQASKQEYDFGATSPTRTTTTTYQYQNNSNYLTPNLLDLPASVQVTGVGPGSYTTYGYDESNCTSGLCGNQTSVHDWLNTTGGYLTTTKAYNSNGLLTSVTDPKGNTTTYSYSGSCYAGSGPISTTNALNQTTWFCYDLNTGVMTGTEDPNNRTTVYSFDNMLRTTQITYPPQTLADNNTLNGVTTFSYPNATEVQISELMDDQSHYRNSTLLVDGFGREIARGTSNGSGGYDETDTCYDGVGHVGFKSYPYQATNVGTGRSCTLPGDTFGYDGLDRTTSVTHSDSAVISTSYSGSYANISDEQSKTRQTYADGLGRLSQVIENPGGLGYTTTYSYDALDNLLGVTQAGSRQRSFVYDSLSQLTSAYNPESGTTSYTYDADGNVTTKTDARGIVTCFGQWTSGACNSGSGGTVCNASIGYDALSRVCTKTYSDGTTPDAYQYDTVSGQPVANGIGRLTVAVGGSSAGCTGDYYAYDAMGRVTYLASSTPTNCTISSDYTTASYDLLGDITTLNYPDGRVVKTKYDPAARPTQVTFDNYQGTSVGYNYLSAASYAATGSPTGLTFGNGVTEATTYNSRMQPCNQQIATGASTWVNRTYSFYSTPSCSGSGGNNGNVFQIADNLQNGRTQNFSYDPLNRLSSAATQATSGSDCWGNTFGYDTWGNLLQQNVTQCSAPYMNLSVNTSNQITNAGFGYDAAGNLTANNGITYQYDAESRLINYASGGALYTYDAEGNRVEKQSSGVTTDYIYFGGQPIAEYNPTTGDWSDYVYAGGRRLAKADNLHSRIHISGTNCGNCGAQYAFIQLGLSSSFTNHVLQPNDKLYFTQYEDSASRGGLVLPLSSGGYATGTDQQGVNIGDEPYQNMWDERIFDLTPYAVNNNTIANVWLTPNSLTAQGNWNLYFESIVLVCADGTVIPAYAPGNSASLVVYAQSSGISNLSEVAEQVSAPTSPNTTIYYHGDHLGSERLITGETGYPLWSATYLPFGEEWNPQETVNHYKFTGKERDSESGLDNFGARYFTSSYGRFMTPDPLGGKRIDPQTLNRYSYVRNNPLTFTDPTGLYTCTDDQNKCKTKKDIAFEKARQQDLKSTDADVLRAANAYGDPTKDNHVSVGFSADLDKKGEGGDTKSSLGADAQGNLFSQSTVTISSNLSGSALDAAVGHEGSHVADAQDVASSVTTTANGGSFVIGQDITRYQSEQRAYAVTDSILKSENESYHFGCGLTGDCILGAQQRMPSELPGIIDRILSNSPLYRANGQPLSPTNQGGSVLGVPQ